MTEDVGPKTRRQPNKSEITAARLQFIKVLAGRKRKFNAPVLQKLGAVNNFDNQTAISWIHLIAKAGVCKRLNHRNWIMLLRPKEEQMSMMGKALGVATYTTPTETPVEIRRRLLAESNSRIKEAVDAVHADADKKKEAIKKIQNIARVNTDALKYKRLVSLVGLETINSILGE